jgi:hypothetical protein
MGERDRQEKREKREKLVSVSVHDCELQVFRAGGKGGQHQNKTSSGVRLVHHASGARSESREERSQLQNKKIAFLKLVKTPAFRVWLGKMLLEGPPAEIRVAEQMREENLAVEGKKDGKWVPLMAALDDEARRLLGEKK